MKLGMKIRINAVIPGEYLTVGDIYEVRTRYHDQVYLSGPFGGTFVAVQALLNYFNHWEAI